MIWKILLGVAIYTLISVVWFVSNLGNKSGQGHWYDWIIGAPVLVLVMLFKAFEGTWFAWVIYGPVIGIAWVVDAVSNSKVGRTVRSWKYRRNKS